MQSHHPFHNFETGVYAIHAAVQAHPAIQRFHGTDSAHEENADRVWCIASLMLRPNRRIGQVKTNMDDSPVLDLRCCKCVQSPAERALINQLV